MRTFARPANLSHLPAAGPVTRWLCGLLLGVSVISTLTQRRWGIGCDLLIFRTDAILSGELWRLITYGFVKTSPMGVVLSTLVLWLIGRSCESNWGSRDYLRFVLSSMVGGAVLAIPLGMLCSLVLPFADIGVAEGPDAAIDAMIVALAMSAPNSNILLGFVLPVPARTILWLLPAFSLLTGLMTGGSTLGFTLGGMAMGYFLVTGAWRPSRLIDRWKLWRLQRRRREGLYVVPPRDNKHTLN